MAAEVESNASASEQNGRSRVSRPNTPMHETALRAAAEASEAAAAHSAAINQLLDGATPATATVLRAERELAELVARKREVERHLALLERQIYHFEASYLEETSHVGNVLRGFDGYLTGPSRLTDSSGRRGLATLKESDRLFSRSSSTYLKALASRDAEKWREGPGSGVDGDQGSPARRRVVTKRKTDDDEEEEVEEDAGDDGGPVNQDGNYGIDSSAEPEETAIERRRRRNRELARKRRAERDRERRAARAAAAASQDAGDVTFAVEATPAVESAEPFEEEEESQIATGEEPPTPAQSAASRRAAQAALSAASEDTPLQRRPPRIQDDDEDLIVE